MGNEHPTYGLGPGLDPVA